MLVAREVQHSLEHFRIPSDIQKRTGVKRIDRIFRDQEELELSADLSGRIEHALAESEFLIVICSPEYGQSPWCVHELETFIRMHGLERVLCVLSAGEPPAIFPEVLLHRKNEVTAEDGSRHIVEESVEPIACDYRGSFRRARRTELPRLAAAMLGCSYDDLVMRREKYRRRRITAITAAAAAAASAAIAYLLWSNAQISSHYRQALISESRLLSSESLEAYEKQDRLLALQDGLEALTGSDPNRPVTDEAMFALSRATFSYTTPYNLLETLRVDRNHDITEWFVSRNGSYLVCMDQTGEFSCYDLPAKKQISSFRLSESSVPDTPQEGSDGQLLCYCDGEVLFADYCTGEILHREPTKYGAVGSVSRSPDGSLIAIADSYLLLVMTADKEAYTGVQIPDLNGMWITGLTWAGDGSCIAVELRESALYTEEPKRYVGLFSLETSAFTLLEGGYSSIERLAFDDDGTLYVLGSQGYEESYRHNGFSLLVRAPYELRAYRDAQLQWTFPLSVSTLTDSPSIRIGTVPDKRIIVALGTSVYLFDENGTLTGYMDSRKEIVQLQEPSADTVGFITSDGEQGTGWPAVSICTLEKTFPEGVGRVESVRSAPDGKERYVAAVGGNLYLYDSVWDENARFLNGSGFPYRPDGFLREDDHAVLLTDRTLLFYDLNSGSQCGSAALPAGDAGHLLTVINKMAYVLLVHGEAGDTSVAGFDLLSGQKVCEYLLPVHDFYCGNGLMEYPFSHGDALLLSAEYAAPSSVAVSGEDLYFHDAFSNSIWRLRLPSGDLEELALQDTASEERIRFVFQENRFLFPSPLSVSPDGQYLFTACTDQEDGSRKALLIRISNGTCVDLPGVPQDLSAVSFISGPNGEAQAVLYSGQHELFTCSVEGELLSSVQWTGDNPISFSEHSGRLYCVFPDAFLRIYEDGNEIRSLPLSFELQGERLNGRYFRFQFTDDRLYLYCGEDLNVIELSGDGSTPVFAASSVLDRMDSNGRLILFSYDPYGQLLDPADGGTGDETASDTAAPKEQLYLVSIDEYSPAELAERAKYQLDSYLPGS